MMTSIKTLIAVRVSYTPMGHRLSYRAIKARKEVFMTFESRDEALKLLDDAIQSGLKDFKAVRFVHEVYDDMFETTSIKCGTIVVDNGTRDNAVELVSYLHKKCYLSNVRGLGKSSVVVKMSFIHIDDDNTTYVTTLWLSRKA